jgi:hypothetical protein
MCECGGCRQCRGRELGLARRRWTLPEGVIERLREAYAAPTYPERVRRLGTLQAEVKLPRRALKLEARRRGWSMFRTHKSWRRWSAEDDERLREGLGHRAVSSVAADLKRSPEAVRSRAYDLGLMARIVDGYSLADVRRCMGVSAARASHWITSGLLKVKDGRVTAESMERFLFAQAHRYDLAFVDQIWFKSIVFGKRG